MSNSTKTLHKNLKDIFGYNNFRGEQEEIINNLLGEMMLWLLCQQAEENQCVINYLH